MTAVEWLLNNLLINGLLRLTQDEHKLYKELKEQAKQMEKEHIIHTYWVAYKEGRYSGDKTAEEYYNETYNK